MIEHDANVMDKLDPQLRAIRREIAPYLSEGKLRWSVKQFGCHVLQHMPWFNHTDGPGEDVSMLLPIIGGGAKHLGFVFIRDHRPGIVVHAFSTEEGGMALLPLLDIDRDEGAPGERICSQILDKRLRRIAKRLPPASAHTRNALRRFVVSWLKGEDTSIGFPRISHHDIVRYAGRGLPPCAVVRVKERWEHARYMMHWPMERRRARLTQAFLEPPRFLWIHALFDGERRLNATVAPVRAAVPVFA